MNDLTTRSPLTGGYISFVTHWLDIPDAGAPETSQARYGRREMRLGVPASPIVRREQWGSLLVTTHQDGRATLWRLGWATPADLLPGSAYESDDGSFRATARPWVADAVYPSTDAALHAMHRR